MNSSGKHRKKAVCLLGVLYITTGVLCNKWLLAATIHDGEIGPRKTLAIFVLQAILIAWGVNCVVCRRNVLLAKLNLALVALVIVFPLFAELGLRLAIMTGIPAVRDPGLYFHPLTDDNYFLYSVKWQYQPPTPDNKATKKNADPVSVNDRIHVKLDYHPELGWAPPESKKNPHGVVCSPEGKSAIPGKSPVLFFGDSFMAGETVFEEKIPSLFQTNNPGYVAYNYGVWGYGVDQIYLRMKRAIDSFDKPFIVFGCLSMDMDRCLLTVRPSPKPYYILDADKLLLKNTPVPKTAPDPLPPTLWFGAMLRQLWIPVVRGQNRVIDNGREEEIKMVNAAVVKKVAALVEENKKKFVALIFVTKHEVEHGSWRADFLEKEFDKYDLPVVRTDDLIRKAIACGKHRVDDYFLGGKAPRFGHPTRLQNRIISERLGKKIHGVR